MAKIKQRGRYGPLVIRGDKWHVDTRDPCKVKVKGSVLGFRHCQ